MIVLLFFSEIIRYPYSLFEGTRTTVNYHKPKSLPSNHKEIKKELTNRTKTTLQTNQTCIKSNFLLFYFIALLNLKGEEENKKKIIEEKKGMRENFFILFITWYFFTFNIIVLSIRGHLVTIRKHSQLIP